MILFIICSKYFLLHKKLVEKDRLFIVAAIWYIFSQIFVKSSFYRTDFKDCKKAFKSECFTIQVAFHTQQTFYDLPNVLLSCLVEEIHFF